MSKFAFSLIFILYLFNCIIQGNAVVTENSKPENSDESQKLEKADENTDNFLSTDQSLSIDFSDIENVRRLYEFLAPGAYKKRRKDLSASKKASFTIVQEFNKENRYFSNKYTLPTITKKISRRRKLTTSNSENTQEIHLCPEINEEYVKSAVNSAHEASPTTRSCLFRKHFTAYEPKICTEEPIPWLMIQDNRQPQLDEEGEEVPFKINCNEETQQLFSFGYNRCDPVNGFLKYSKTVLLITPSKRESLAPFKIKDRDTYLMYQICYDTQSHKPLWTSHQILNPMLIHDPTIPKKNIERIDLDTINTSTFGYDFLSSEAFANLKNIYQQNKISNNINPEYLVPMKHMAMQNWKKSTQHLINTAPLHEKFHRLMQIIDEGLITAARFFNSLGENLQIFTTVDIKQDQNNNIQDTIWYKFIYRTRKRSGVLIHIGDIIKDKENNKLSCTNDLRCDFNTWVKPEADLEEDVLKYAGCCEVYQFRINQLFQIDVDIVEPLDINKIISYAEKNDTRIQLLEDLLTDDEIKTSQQDDQNPKPSDTNSNEKEFLRGDSEEENKNGPDRAEMQKNSSDFFTETKLKP